MNYRNPQLLVIVRQLPCQNCGISDGTVCAAHSNQQLDGKGIGIKSHDYRIAALCSFCHHQIDNGNAFSREERIDIWERAHRKTIGALFELGMIGVVK